MIKASVIGWPISHSRSPLIHGYWLKTLGLNGSYHKEAVAPENLGAFIANLHTGEHVGTNVTIPHKEAAIAFVDEPDDRVRRTGSLNTIWRDGNRLLASSTDGQGFVANVVQTLPGFDITSAPALVLGAGGSARAIVDELLRQGLNSILVWNRNPERAQALAQHFGQSVVAVGDSELPGAFSKCGFLINTTAAGMNGASSLDLPWNTLRQNVVVADIVYTPLITPFLQTAKAKGHAIVPGLGMLLHQAVFGFEKWFGVRPHVTPALYAFIARDIDPEYKP
jgi:shikimate dehydrogenase